MEILSVIAVTLYAVVAVTFITNLLQVFAESKKLRAEGKTPLTGKNLTTVTLAAVAEAILATLVIILASALDMTINVFTVAMTFLIGYLFRNVAAYLAAWGMWSLFVKIDTRKAKKEVKKDQEGAI